MLGSRSYNNNVRTTLNAGILAADTTIPIVEATAPYNNPPVITTSNPPAFFTLVDNLAAPTKIEIIRAGTVSAPSAGVVTLTNVTRGQDGTTAQDWAGGSIVLQSLNKAVLNPDTIRFIGNESFGGFFGAGIGAWERVIKVRSTEGVCINPDDDGLYIRFTGIDGGHGYFNGPVYAQTLSTGGTVTVGQNLDVVGIGSFGAGNLRITLGAPASSSAAGQAGQIRLDANFIYVCTATNTWKRAALSAY